MRRWCGGMRDLRGECLPEAGLHGVPGLRTGEGCGEGVAGQSCVKCYNLWVDSCTEASACRPAALLDAFVRVRVKFVCLEQTRSRIQLHIIALAM